MLIQGHFYKKNTKNKQHDQGWQLDPKEHICSDVKGISTKLQGICYNNERGYNKQTQNQNKTPQLNIIQNIQDA